jgi:hypothetical protein
VKFKTAIAAVIVSAFALPVLAQTGAPANPAATPGIDRRQANQEKRIDQGVRSGELTQREAARLERGQDRVQKIEDKAKADGSVTAQERKRIHKAQDSQSRKIYREKHDRQHDRNHDGRIDRPGRNK